MPARPPSLQDKAAPVLRGFLLLAAALMTSGCVGTQRISASWPAISPETLQVDLIFDDLGGSSHDESTVQEIIAEAPGNVRPCCAFGYNLGFQLGSMPVPGFRMDNVVEPTDIGQHQYNPTLMSVEYGLSNGFLSGEVNGLTYTCRGGFIDVAHVRDYADWTVYLIGQIESVIDTGGVLELPYEAGDRFVYVAAPGELLIERVGRRDLAIALAQWLAFNLSIWHEAATWYGWATWSAFPEEASAFSPEDLYSNLVGIKIAGEIARTTPVLSATQFNRNMDQGIRTVLDRLGAMPPHGTRHAADSIDGLWWDSTQLLPNKRLVLRRNFQTGPLLLPWIVPQARYSPAMQGAVESYCDGAKPPVALVVPGQVEGIEIAELVRLDIRVAPAVAVRIATDIEWMSQHDVVILASTVERENSKEFGDHANRPH